MNSNAVLLLIVAALVAIPLVISLVVTGGAKAIESTIGSARSTRATGQRSFLSSWGPDALAGTLVTRFAEEGWTCDRRERDIRATSPGGGVCRVSLVARPAGSRLDVVAERGPIETVAADVLRVLRSVDPKARVKAVGA